MAQLSNIEIHLVHIHTFLFTLINSSLQSVATQHNSFFVRCQYLLVSYPHIASNFRSSENDLYILQLCVSLNMSPIIHQALIHFFVCILPLRTNYRHEGITSHICFNRDTQRPLHTLL